MSRPAAMPLRSNFVTGRSAQRSTTPPVEQRLGVEHLDHLLGVVGPVGRQPPLGAGRQPARGQAREAGRDQPALVVPRLVPRVGEEDPEAGQAVRARRGARATRRRRRSASARWSGPAAPIRPRVSATPGRHTSNATTSWSGRAAASSTVDSPMPEPISTISGASRPKQPGEREARLVDRLVGQPPPLGVRRPGLLLARGEPAAPSGVGQHLAHPPAVVGQLVVRARRSDAVSRSWAYLPKHDRPHPTRRPSAPPRRTASSRPTPGPPSSPSRRAARCSPACRCPG